ncbi:F0F1 ATP synthase subunit delta [Mycoplasma sp. T363T]|uniref:ATP synthase subunit delta n=1 Tax=Mycoplasma bradburyae TaxID=2963128 RepID=A0AAW6HNY3_9MOLU|nr:ATP synthase F1 subunit delta [Mycoplasma bradburyae]MDC4163342.1 F0F1 ATP synthase subunit delta [Mycoplasma bradburyae]MDC4181956.1 F0F1 ATP synthase subunit delta [Mycoplasma bradburyae]MDC4182659.1 F0F1 ATP synthase subunit delta [Mycoplasma bradburyae]MDC4183331.1 F0F1 ATP synthase subunit delta [Mycoplasma bradburyae]UTS70381.1 ATP synthase F1 subunit delta [Mycoplasma bradburyae]
MDTNIIGFARALVDLAHEENKVSQFYDDLRIVFNLVKKDNDLMSLLNNKVLSKNQKHEIIDIVFKDKLNETIVNFLKVVIDNHEFFNILTIIKKFFRMIEEENHTLFIKVISAQEMSDSEKAQLAEKLHKKFDSELNILYQVDPSLIAGIRIQSNDLLIDHTIDGKLKLLKNRLKTLTKGN